MQWTPPDKNPGRFPARQLTSMALSENVYIYMIYMYKYKYILGVIFHSIFHVASHIYHKTIHYNCLQLARWRLWAAWRRQNVNVTPCHGYWEIWQPSTNNDQHILLMMIPFLMIMIIVDDTIIYGLFIDDSILYGINNGSNSTYCRICWTSYICYAHQWFLDVIHPR